MKVALVHDYLNEYGGAERVLEVLSKMYPEAPIYTAFAVPGSTAVKAFSGRKIITSWFGKIPFYKKLYSPLRFLIPAIWGSFDLSGFDVVITSASWYVTKGMKRGQAVEICYCHTPPRWLYGYETSVNWQKWWIVRVYALIVGHFLRMYDFAQAQRVDTFVANSNNVADRIRKFYKREAEVICPPVTHPSPSLNLREGNLLGKSDYYLMVTRIVGGKGIEMAVEVAQKYGIKLKIAGETTGFRNFDLDNNKNVEYLGRVSDEQKFELMAQAKAFLALSRDEDFGITPVEAQMCGTPVIAFNGGGYKETVVDGETGVLFDEYSEKGLWEAIQKFNKLKWTREKILNNAKKFSEEMFVKKMTALVDTLT